MAHRPARLRARLGGRDDDGDPARGAAGAARDAGERPAALERVVQHCLEKRPDGAVPVGARPRLRSAALVGRPALGGASAPAARAVSRGPAPIAGARSRPRSLVGARRCRRPAGHGRAGGRGRPRRRAPSILRAGHRSARRRDDARPLPRRQDASSTRRRDGGDSDSTCCASAARNPIPLTADSPSGRLGAGVLARRRAHRLPLGARRRRHLPDGGDRRVGHALTDFGYSPSWSPDGREIVVVAERIRVADRISGSGDRAVGGRRQVRPARATLADRATRCSRPGRRTAGASPSGACAARAASATSGPSPPTARTPRSGGVAVTDDAALDWARPGRPTGAGSISRATAAAR